MSAISPHSLLGAHNASAPLNPPTEVSVARLAAVIAVVALAALSISINFLLFPMPLSLTISAVELMIICAIACPGEISCPSSRRSLEPDVPLSYSSVFRSYQPPIYLTMDQRRTYRPIAVDRRPCETVGDGHINFSRFQPSAPPAREVVGDGYLNLSSFRTPLPQPLNIDSSSREPVGRRGPQTTFPERTVHQPMIASAINQPERDPVGRRN